MIILYFIDCQKDIFDPRKILNKCSHEFSPYKVNKKIHYLQKDIVKLNKSQDKKYLDSRFMIYNKEISEYELKSDEFRKMGD